MSATAADTRRAGGRVSDAAVAADRPACCGLYHRAIELVGKRWTGAILLVLMDGPLHFSGIRHLVPELSDRLLSERLKELEAEGIVQRVVTPQTPVRVEYHLTPKGRALADVFDAIGAWAHAWLDESVSGARAVR